MSPDQFSFTKRWNDCVEIKLRSDTFLRITSRYVYNRSLFVILLIAKLLKLKYQGYSFEDKARKDEEIEDEEILKTWSL